MKSLVIPLFAELHLSAVPNARRGDVVLPLADCVSLRAGFGSVPAAAGLSEEPLLEFHLAFVTEEPVSDLPCHVRKAGG